MSAPKTYKQVALDPKFVTKIESVAKANGQTIKGYIETNLAKKLEKDHAKIKNQSNSEE